VGVAPLPPLPGRSRMRFNTYRKYEGSLLDALNLEALLEHLSDLLLDGGFAGGPHFHPWWGWSGGEDTNSLDALKEALLRALLESGQWKPELLSEFEEGAEGSAAMAKLLDELVRRLAEAGYLDLHPGAAGEGAEGIEGSQESASGHEREARKASLAVDFSLTGKGMDFLGYRALRELLGALGSAGVGSHETRHLSPGIESGGGSRPYQFGDALNLDLTGTLLEAIRRQGPELPLTLEPEDLLVHQSDFRSSCATVLLLDISHSMVLYGEDRFGPAKRVALALSHLIRTHFPGDVLRVVTFGDRAQEIPLPRLGSAQVGPFHTNTAEGLELARRILLAERKEMRQIVMITDGKPSAMTLPDGRVYVNSGGLDPAILRHTFREVGACRRSGILINTFMLARDPSLVQFVEKVSEIARGKAYLTSTMTLGQYVMMDFLRGKRKRG